MAQALAGLAAEPDGTVALSLAVSSGVEGKLNMLLIAARERMIDSLFAVVDAVSQSLGLQQEAGESNAGYALRLADTISELPPRQLAVLQQQLSAQGQTAPLSLVAAALHDPAGTQAAQLVAYLEVVRYKDKDLATKSVVASYGQNDGSTETEAFTPSESAVRLPPAQAATPANPALAMPQPAASAAAAPPSPAAIAAPADPLAALIETPEPLSPPMPPAVSGPAADAPARAQSAAPQANAVPSTLSNPADVVPTTAADMPQTTAQIPAAAAAAAEQATTPRAILQIRSEIQEGLKVVFDRLVETTGAPLLQTMSEAAPLADRLIAQALIADMIDGTELDGLPMPDDSTAARQAAAPGNAIPASLTASEPAEAPAVQLLAANRLLADKPEQTQAAVPPQAAAVPPALGIGFVTTPYAPADDVVKYKDTLRIDRVDAVDDDEHEDPGGRQPGAESEDEAETPAEEALELLAAEPDASAPLADGRPEGRALPIALPQPASAEPEANRSYDIYERMGA